MEAKEVLLDELKRLQTFRPFSFSEVEEAYATEMAKSIVRMLKKLGLNSGDIFVYDERMARLRGLQYDDDECYYGVSYTEYKTFPKWDLNTNIDVDGTCYRLMDYWHEFTEWDPNAINCMEIQIGFIENLESIYGYLRTELQLPAKKRRFTIQRKEA